MRRDTDLDTAHKSWNVLFDFSPRDNANFHAALLREPPLNCITNSTKYMRFVKSLSRRVFFVCNLLVLYRTSLYLRNSSFEHTPGNREFLAAFRSCKDYVRSASVGFEARRSLPFQLTQFLAGVDHVFIISFDGCVSQVLPVLAGRSSCVLGKMVDSCTPAKFVRGGYSHAMKVTITHAFILQLAHESRYKHIAVI